MRYVSFILLNLLCSEQYKTYFNFITYLSILPKIVCMAEIQNHLYLTPEKTRKNLELYEDCSSQSFDPKQFSPYSTRTICSNSQISSSQYSFRPIIQPKSLTQIEDGQSWTITDRYIPSRKLLKKDSLIYHEESNSSKQNQNNKCQSSSTSVSDIFKRFIMSQTNRPKQKFIETFENNNILRYSQKNIQLANDSGNFSKNSSLQLAQQLSSGTKRKRKINKLPCKVLDAPALQDDYYLNLIDWSTQNFLAVGLASSVYLWNASNSKVTKLCDLGLSDSATSVSWATKGPLFSLGTNSGQVQIWDVNKMKRLRVLHGHTNRVGAISWNSSILSTGSRDKTILHRDLRANTAFVNKLIGHKQQICGLKWSFDEQQLCSGGNDNKLLIWNNHSNEPIIKFNDHVAAVKAMAWSPHQHGLLVSGGGTADRTIRFRNTLTGTTLKTMDAGSQVCNLMFSKTLNEIVSTHGYSHNQINIWKYPNMQKVATLTGHTYRVLYLAMSPDGSTIVTGAGDETLRFWNIFPSRNQQGKKLNSTLNTDSIVLR